MLHIIMIMWLYIWSYTASVRYTSP